MSTCGGWCDDWHAWDGGAGKDVEGRTHGSVLLGEHGRACELTLGVPHLKTFVKRKFGGFGRVDAGRILEQSRVELGTPRRAVGRVVAVFADGACRLLVVREVAGCHEFLEVGVVTARGAEKTFHQVPLFVAGAVRRVVDVVFGERRSKNQAEEHVVVERSGGRTVVDGKEGVGAPRVVGTVTLAADK